MALISAAVRPALCACSCVLPGQSSCVRAQGTDCSVYCMQRGCHCRLGTYTPCCFVRSAQRYACCRSGSAARRPVRVCLLVQHQQSVQICVVLQLFASILALGVHLKCRCTLCEWSWGHTHHQGTGISVTVYQQGLSADGYNLLCTHQRPPRGQRQRER